MVAYKSSAQGKVMCKAGHSQALYNHHFRMARKSFAQGKDMLKAVPELVLTVPGQQDMALPKVAYICKATGNGNVYLFKGGIEEVWVVSHLLLTGLCCRVLEASLWL